MSLREYRARRDFDKTPEPQGSTGRRKGRRFVVQKHAASRLHYDFRLEEDGVLKSWAVPKGPSLDPKQKRLAVQVEDHPLDYGDFEGIIPKGQYGGGTVMVWDEGVWEPAKGDIGKGRLKFRLEGNKLHGGWSLVRLQEEDNWLLIKEDDEFARSSPDVTEQDTSVLSGRTMAEIAEAGERVWHSDRAGPDVAELPGAVKRKFPREVSLQLATLEAVPPAGEGWLHEIKYDGYRLLVYKDRDEVRLITRGHQDWSQHFPHLVRAVAQLPVNQAVLDGEVVVLDEQGRSSFQRLQKALKGGGEEAVFYAFDLPYCGEHDLRQVPLLKRKQALRELLYGCLDALRFSEHIAGQGPAVLEQACQLGCEGIVSKRADASYSGRRTRDWLKCKCLQTDEFVVVGYTRPKGGRHGFGALILAQPGEDGLRYCGRVGTGFNEAALTKITRQLEELPTDRPPLAEVPAAQRRGVTWVQPRLQARVSYAERTEEGILRHPSFESLSLRKPAGVKISHPDRLIDKEHKITKGELAEYYERVGEWLVPHLYDRPLTLVRCPDGLAGQCFYQKHRAPGLPRSVLSVEVVEEDGDPAEYLTIRTVEGLLALVQMGVIEFHPWGARKDQLEKPDRLIFDLDPDTGLPWSKVVEAGLEVRDQLAELGLRSFCKTTGGKGLHVVVPILRYSDWKEAKGFASSFAEALARIRPERYTDNPLKARRKGKIFLDYLRNGRGATSVAAYSVRARSGCPISLPIDWSDLTDELVPSRLTLRDFQGLAERGRRAWSALDELRQRLG